MKKICALLTLLCLLFSTIPACALESAPECMGTVTDLALVIGDAAQKDLDTLRRRYQDATGGKLYLVTRHFIGGRDVQEYADTLFDLWSLEENDVLLLMVIGEESYGMSLGKKAAAALPGEARATLFAAHFHDAFMRREYDKAAGDMCMAALSRIASHQDEKLNTSGLFGSAVSQSPLHVYEQELTGLFSSFFEEEEPEREQPSVLREDKSTGISIWKILLIFFILRAVLRKRKRKKRRILF